MKINSAEWNMNRQARMGWNENQYIPFLQTVAN